MKKTPVLLSLRLNRRAATNLTIQLYEGIRQEILSGKWRAGDSVPSTRQLAVQLGVARSTVIDSYRQLISEGYLQSRASSETTVSETLPVVAAKLCKQPAADKQQQGLLSDLGKRLWHVDLTEQWPSRREISFYPWSTALDELPLEEWSRAIWRKTRQPEKSLLEFAEDRVGNIALRKSIASVVAPGRGIKCSAEQVIMTAGWAQSLDIVCRVFINAGDSIAIESPSFMKDRLALELNGAKVVPVPVDQHGMNIDYLIDRVGDCKLIYLTPSHQFPTGAVLSLARRLQLLDWARKNCKLIIEDDYDSEHRYVGQPIPALKALDEHESVLYIETFSKILYPSVGVGYLIAPTTYAKVLANARRLSCDPLQSQLQEALAVFIDEGHLQRHRKRMRLIYQERRQALVSALNKYLGKQAMIMGDDAGLHVLARFATTLTAQELVRKAAAFGVGLLSSAEFYDKKPPECEFVLGYADLTPAQIKEGIKRLAAIIKAERLSRQT